MRCDLNERLIESLTEKESAVMSFLCKGLTRPEIAVGLGISENTVKHHMKNIYSKYGVGTRADAIELYVARG